MASDVVGRAGAGGRSVAVERLDRGAREQAVRVLTAAFHDYPVMRFVIGPDPDYEGKLDALVGFYCDKRFLRGWPVLGIREGGETVAVALVSTPLPRHPASVLDGPMERLRDRLGEAAWERMRRFELASDRNEPEGRHHFVGMLGVVPRRQGRGYGMRLLRHVRALALEEGSDGVCLSTEDPGNLPFYERAGFRVVAEADVDDLHTWCLHRPVGGA